MCYFQPVFKIFKTKWLISDANGDLPSKLALQHPAPQGAITVQTRPSPENRECLDYARFLPFSNFLYAPLLIWTLNVRFARNLPFPGSGRMS
jgi:hypothetical protein